MPIMLDEKELDEKELGIVDLDRQILHLSEELGRPMADMFKKVKASVAVEFKAGGKVLAKKVGPKLNGKEVGYGARSRSATGRVISSRVLNFSQKPTVAVDCKGRSPSKSRDLRPKIEQPNRGP